MTAKTAKADKADKIDPIDPIDSTDEAPACLVRAAGPSVRAAGHRFGAEPVQFAAGELSAEDYAALCADSRVVVMLPPPAPQGDG